MQQNMSLQKDHKNRPSWDEYFIELVDTVAKRATCDRGFSGCIIAKDNKILTSGYVGAPSGFKDCFEVGHLFREVIYPNGIVKQHCIRTIHAEQNAVAQAAKYGIAIEGATLYCSMEPCFSCAMLIVSTGIKRVVAKNLYHAAGDSRAVLIEAGIELVVLLKEELKY